MKIIFRSILVSPNARDRSIALATHRCRPEYMAVWLEDHVTAIGSLTLNFGFFLVESCNLETKRGPYVRSGGPSVGKEGECDVES
jgi:hypothetical protein